MTQYFVRFFSPDLTAPRTFDRKIDPTDNAEGILQKAFNDKTVFALQFFTRESIGAAENTFLPEPIKYFGTSVAVSTLITLNPRELAVNGISEYLIPTLIRNGHEFAVKTRTGQWLALTTGDEVYDSIDCSLKLKVLDDNRAPTAAALTI